MMNESRDVYEEVVDKITSGRSDKEQAAFLVKQHWAQMKQQMEAIMLLVEQAKHVPDATRIEMDGTFNNLHSELYNLRPPFVVKELTIEQQAYHAKQIEENEARKEQKSDIQECVDCWLLAKFEEYGLKPELLEDSDTERFIYEYTETVREYKSGEVEFDVPYLVKERLEALMKEDFKSELQEHLDNAQHDEFYLDMQHDDGEVVDSSSTLT